MTPKEIEKLFNHPAELSAKTDGKGNGQVALRGEVADLGWLVNKVVTGIYAQVDDPDTVRALDAAITMTIHLRATKRVKELLPVLDLQHPFAGHPGRSFVYGLAKSADWRFLITPA